jgi:putative transposase
VRERDHWHSCTYKEYGNGARLETSALVLLPIGRIALRWSRPVEGTITTVTVSQEEDGWYVCCSCADVPTQQVDATTCYCMLLDASQASNSTWRRLPYRPMVYAVRTRASTARPSARCRKASAGCLGGRRAGRGVARPRTSLPGKPQQVRRQHQDFHHNVALALVRQHDTISHEDLQTANLRKNHHLAGRSVTRVGPGSWTSCTARQHAPVAPSSPCPPAHTLHICSGCGVLVQRGLSVRWYACPDCGISIHRDHNAAKNLYWRGPCLWGTPGGGWGAEPRTRRAVARAQCQGNDASRPTGEGRGRDWIPTSTCQRRKFGWCSKKGRRAHE